MENNTETPERRAYREKCGYRDEWNEQCYLRSGSDGKCFYEAACSANANCRRMKMYDKKHEVK